MHSQPARVGLCSGMYQVDANRYPLRMRWWLVVAWNLVFAVIATLVWLVARDD